MLQVHVRDFRFIIPQPRAVGQDHLRVRHIHYVRTTSVRARGNHLEHVHEGAASELEQDNYGIFTSDICCDRYL